MSTAASLMTVAIVPARHKLLPPKKAVDLERYAGFSVRLLRQFLVFGKAMNMGAHG
jgi:hypothetical protein